MLSSASHLQRLGRLVCARLPSSTKAPRTNTVAHTQEPTSSFPITTARRVIGMRERDRQTDRQIAFLFYLRQ